MFDLIRELNLFIFICKNQHKNSTYHKMRAIMYDSSVVSDWNLLNYHENIILI